MLHGSIENLNQVRRVPQDDDIAGRYSNWRSARPIRDLRLRIRDRNNYLSYLGLTYSRPAGIRTRIGHRFGTVVGRGYGFKSNSIRHSHRPEQKKGGEIPSPYGKC